MAVTAQHEVHIVGLEDRIEVLAHADEVRLVVRVVAALGVRRVMEIHDGPGLGVGREIVFQPFCHHAVRIVRTGHRVQADQMDVAVVERVILGTARRDAARLAVARRVEHVEIREMGI